jgi:hypothetical protein
MCSVVERKKKSIERDIRTRRDLQQVLSRHYTPRRDSHETGVNFGYFALDKVTTSIDFWGIFVLLPA